MLIKVHMSDWAILISVAAALYVVECLVWVPTGTSVCFKHPVSGKWRAAKGARLPGNERGGFTLCDPFSVSGTVVVCADWDICIAPEGVSNILQGAYGDEALFYHFDDIKSVRAELDEVRINDQRFLRASSPAAALNVVTRVERVWRQPREQRAAEIDALIAQGLDAQAITEKWARFQERTRALTFWCSILLAFIYVAAPVILFAVGPYPSWLYLLAALIAIAATIAVRYLRVHQHLYPSSRFDRWVHVASMVLFPVAALKCVDKLSRDVFSAYSPVVVVAVMCGPNIAAPFIREYLADVQRASSASAEESANASQACAIGFNARVAAAVESVLEPLGVVLMPPSPESASAMAYCPRCEAQFMTMRDGRCADCPDVELVPFNAVDLSDNRDAIRT